MVEIRKAEKDDLKKLAEIYRAAYDRPEFGENWSLDRAKNLLEFYYNIQTSISLTAVSNGEIVGGFFSYVKPWHDGNRLGEGELFVAAEYQGQGIGSMLMLEMMNEAEREGCNIHELLAYGKVAEWYRSLGMEDTELHHMEGSVEKIKRALMEKNENLGENKIY